MNYFCLIPKEIVKEILCFCSLYDRFCCQFVNKQWKEIINQIEKSSTQEMINNAITDEEINILEWLIKKQSYKIIDDCYNWAIIFENIKVLQWLRKENFSWSGSEWNEITHRSFYDTVEPINESLIAILEWLFKEKCPLDDSQFRHILEYGSKELCLWMIDHFTITEYIKEEWEFAAPHMDGIREYEIYDAIMKKYELQSREM